MECGICHAEVPIVLTSGYAMCDRCVRFQERSTITKMVIDVFPDWTMSRAEKVLQEMFGSEEFGFPDFPKLYDRFPRGKWDEKGQCFEVPQAEYISESFIRFVKRGEHV